MSQCFFFLKLFVLNHAVTCSRESHKPIFEHSHRLQCQTFDSIDRELSGGPKKKKFTAVIHNHHDRSVFLLHLFQLVC